MYKTAGAAVVLTALLTVTTAWGMDLPTRKWWNNPALAQKLHLTAEEEAVLDQKFVEARRVMLQIKGHMEVLRFELETALETEPLDEARVMEQFRLLEEQRSRLIREGFDFILETRRLLGVERFRQLKAIHDEVRARKGRKGKTDLPR